MRISFIILLFFFVVVVNGQNGSTLPYFQKDKWIENTFGFQMTVRNFEAKFSTLFTISKKLNKNSYDQSVVDTIYTFSKGKTIIEIYHSKTRDILMSAFIEDPNLVLKNNIKIGITKSEIEKVLNINTKSNRFQVGDLEHNQVYTFNFINNKLTTITYDGYIE